MSPLSAGTLFRLLQEQADFQSLNHSFAFRRRWLNQKAKAFLLLKRLARAGRDAFKNDPATAAKLNLDILRRKGHKQDGAEVTPAPTPAA